MPEWLSHSSHWGAFSGSFRDGRLSIRPDLRDPAPSPILNNIPALLKAENRLLTPMVRRGWLDNGPGPDSRRGKDSYVAVSWDRAIELAAAELQRIAEGPGPESIFGGSYGWSSAGRFHHAQSQVHRFLNYVLGGYVRSVNTYSNGTAGVLLPHILGDVSRVTRDNDDWKQLADHSEVILAFGGLPVRNAMVSSGGNSKHVAPGSIAKAASRGARFFLVSPIRDDMPEEANAEWLAVQPGTDTALCLALAYVVITENLLDRDFIARATTGYDIFEAYLLGKGEEPAKSPAWAETICGISAQKIAELARLIASKRTLITASYSLQRQVFGEQPIWAALALAAILGRMTEPGCGFSFGLSSIGNVGKRPLGAPLPTLDQGRNGVKTFIPVARIADMLLSPGEEYQYDGRTLVYPDVRLVYWAGGNPFHHHQNLPRLARAFAQPDTIIVHDAVPTATTAHADIVFPATTTLERNDIGAAGNDTALIAMKQLVEPVGEALDDYDIFARLARALGKEELFTEGRSSAEWLRHLYRPLEEALAKTNHDAPDFDTFWEDGRLELPESDRPLYLRGFAEDPEARPLTTPSGRIEIASERIASFNYDDCLGYPVWLGRGEADPEVNPWPLVLIANQPARRLHSQIDFGQYSQDGKVAGREALSMHPEDAAARGVEDGMLVRVFNDQGACLAGVIVTSGIMPGVVQLSTGAWYSPAETLVDGKTLCLSGNPNVLTRDVPSSKLSQGCSGQVTRVEIEAFTQSIPQSALGPYIRSDAAMPDMQGLEDFKGKTQ